MRSSAFAILSCTALLMGASAVQASVTISSDATKNMSCGAGVCSPTAKKAVLNVDDLTVMLASGDVKVTTGHDAVTITVAAPFSWTSKHRLTLDAKYNVSFRAPVTVAGAGAVTIAYNDGGSGGDLLFFPGAKLDFWDTASSLIVNGVSYTLVNSVTNLAGAVKTNPSGAYALANDYDAAANGTYRESPVATIFAGSFEGLGHSIANLAIQGHRDVGFFVGAQPSATVRDIDIANANVVSTGQAVKVGILIAESHGLVDRASASGSIQAPSSKKNVSSVGGLVGANVGTVSNSSAAATVSAADHTAVGGLVGFNGNGASILKSYATGDVSGGKKSFAGGVAGFSYGLSDCYALGEVQGGSRSSAGGLIGSGDNTGRSYSTGTATGGSGALVGGSMGDARGGDADIYWDADTSGTSQGCGTGDCGGVTGLSDSQLKSALPDGFDPAVWGQNPSINNGYPYLLANPPPE